MSRVLVTGGAGYIGSHLVDLLLTRGHSVTVLDNLSTGKIENLSNSLGNIRFLNGSILDKELVDTEVAQADLVFHLAAAVGVTHIVDNPLGSLLTNATGTENVLSACFKYWKRVLVASTSEVYGKTETIPMTEDDDRVLGSTKVHRWGYSTAKALDEHLALAYHQHGLPVSIVRYFNSFGPRIDPRGYGSVVASFMGRAIDGEPLIIHGTGEQTRCFTYCDDTVMGTYLAGTLDAAIGEVFNVGNPVETSILELANAVQTLIGTDLPVICEPYEKHFGAGFEDTRRRVPSVDRIKNLLGWEPTIALEDGLSKTLEWWKQAHNS